MPISQNLLVVNNWAVRSRASQPSPLPIIYCGLSSSWLGPVQEATADVRSCMHWLYHSQKTEVHTPFTCLLANPLLLPILSQCPCSLRGGLISIQFRVKNSITTLLLVCWGWAVICLSIDYSLPIISSLIKAGHCICL